MARHGHAAPVAVARRSPRLLRGERRWRLLPAIILLARDTCGQITTTTRGALFGPKFVLTTYSNSACTKPKTGQGYTQSWTRAMGSDSCYQLTTGYLCSDTSLCVLMLDCNYNTGSGVVYYTLSQTDTQCQGSRALLEPKPFAPTLYWLQAQALFTGGCVKMGAGYMQFTPALDSGGFPNCSRYGDVAPGEDADAQVYEAQYNLQFYVDSRCSQIYNISTFGGGRLTSRFTFKVYRGVQYCYDMIDSTPRGNVSSSVINYNKLDWRWVCGNLDSYGNGYLFQEYSGPKCSGDKSGTPQGWTSVFYPVNYPAVQNMFHGQCTQWGQYYVRFDTAWDPAHFPDCMASACKSGSCSGGIIRDPTDSTGQLYGGAISTSGGDVANPRTAATAGAARLRVGAASASVVAGTVFALSALGSTAHP